MKFLHSLILTLFLVFTANAQGRESLTELKGTVVDQLGAVIKSTRVVLSNGQGKKFDAITDEDGVKSVFRQALIY